MFNEINTLKKEIEKLKNINEELLKENSKLKLDNASLQERYNKMVAAKYQSQRNNVIFDMPTLFDDIEEEALKS